MPHEGFADPVTSDRTGFRSNMPISELTERVTRAIEASDVNSTPLVAGNCERGDNHFRQKMLGSPPRGIP